MARQGKAGSRLPNLRKAGSGVRRTGAWCPVGARCVRELVAQCGSAVAIPNARNAHVKRLCCHQNAVWETSVARSGNQIQWHCGNGDMRWKGGSGNGGRKYGSRARRAVRYGRQG